MSMVPANASPMLGQGALTYAAPVAKIHTSLIAYKHLKFLVFDAPSNQNVGLYLTELKSYGVTDVVRVCEPTYDKGVLESAGITVHEWPFTDGEAPPKTIVQSWLALVEKRFGGLTKVRDLAAATPPAGGGSATSSPAGTAATPCIGVHCVAGLGRAPVLVAMALIESGMAPLDSVIYIRERRRGAINARQLKYIEAYKRQGKKECVIM